MVTHSGTLFFFLDNFDFMEGMQLQFNRPIIGRQRGLALYFICYRFKFRYNPRTWVLRQLNHPAVNPILQYD